MSARKEPLIINGVECWLCPGCKNHKTAREFYKSKYAANRLSSYCRICQNELTKDFQKRRAQRRKKDELELQELRARVTA